MKSKVSISVATPGILNTGITESQGIQMFDQKRSIPKFVAKVVEKFLQGKEIIIVGRDHQIKLLQWFVSRKLAKRILYLVVKQSFGFKN